jgi:hypothetical protein
MAAPTNGLVFLDLRGHVENDGGFALTSDLVIAGDWDDFGLRPACRLRLARQQRSYRHEPILAS